ncbi:D-Ala-D-Ala carboxypeptidase family metallohydrolase [Enterobacter asburiae]|uniref:D-Ala-D-Ala carboxypeptidase family metallohydrolase n=1 Tax=Enterobacter asburiae TaxID=61645 RepID=UPI0020066B95|nr:D-Ala-D-Ala carboxypeptidase family metallohydrolase [Enterobacter asburiae]MCK7229176.1 D-Ala-D-Ala carboxypeptidase family metallohydrolase [Enterobacter asburiae]
MGDLSEHFSRHEFACRCGCGFDDISSDLIAVLETARDWFAAPIHINCGCRCAAHNARVGGVPDSQHQKGTAADITLSGVTPAALYSWFDSHYPQMLGLGKYRTFVHVDVRHQRTRWTG